MNETVVLDDVPVWCTTGPQGLCFVQTITRQLGNRNGNDVLRQWIAKMRERLQREKVQSVKTPPAPPRSSGLYPSMPNPAVTGDIDDFMLAHIHPGQDDDLVDEIGNLITTIKTQYKQSGKPLVLVKFSLYYNVHPSR